MKFSLWSEDIKMVNIKKISKQNRSVFYNMAGAFFVKGISLIFSLLTMPAYIHFFKNQTILGIWFTILSILNWVLMFDLGLGNGLRNKLPKALADNDKRVAREYISTTYFSTICVVTIFTTICFILFPIINWNDVFNVDPAIIKNEVLLSSVKIVFVGIMFQLILKLISSISFAIQKSAIVNLISLITNIIILIFIKILPSSTLEENIYRISWINVIAVNLPLVILTIIYFKVHLKGLSPKISFVRKDFIVELLKIGLSLLWLQLIFMVISSTNEFLISYFTTPDAVVEYQAYFKIFNSVATVFSLALTPIWSAVTKAQIEKRYIWIKKIYKLFLGSTCVCIALNFCIIPFLQKIFNVWLGDSMVIANVFYSAIFAVSSGIFILHNVNTSIGNGMSYFRIQMILMTLAAIVDIPLAYLFVQLTGGWIGVVIANIIALIPYEFLAPVFTMKKIDTDIAIQKMSTVRIDEKT